MPSICVESKDDGSFQVKELTEISNKVALFIIEIQYAFNSQGRKAYLGHYTSTRYFIRIQFDKTLEDGFRCMDTKSPNFMMT